MTSRWTSEAAAKAVARVAGKVLGSTADSQIPLRRAEVAAKDRGRADFHENTPDRSLPHSESECDEAPALDGADAREAEGVSLVTVRFTGYRVRPLDPDNFAGSCKDLLDGLRHAGILLGDEPWRIRLEAEQVRVKGFAAERTEIVITFPAPAYNKSAPTPGRITP